MWILQRLQQRCIHTASFPFIRLKHFALLTAVFSICAPVAFGAKSTTAGITAVQAEMMNDVNARLLKVGGVIYARVTVDWKSPDCELRSGAILEGHVLSVS